MTPIEAILLSLKAERIAGHEFAALMLRLGVRIKVDVIYTETGRVS